MSSKGRLEEKLGFRSKKLNSYCFVGLGVSQLAIALYIYRVGWSVPFMSRNPYKSCIKIQLLTRTRLFRPVWPPLDRSNRSDRGAGLPGGITSSSGLQIRRSIYAFQSSRRDLCNGAVQLTIWQTYPDRSDQFIWQVWPACPDCQLILSCANFECQQK